MEMRFDPKLDGIIKRPEVSLSSVLEFIQTLNAQDLKKVQDAVRAQKKSLPMILELPSSISEINCWVNVHTVSF